MYGSTQSEHNNFHPSPFEPGHLETKSVVHYYIRHATAGAAANDNRLIRAYVMIHMRVRIDMVKNGRRAEKKNGLEQRTGKNKPLRGEGTVGPGVPGGSGILGARGPVEINLRLFEILIGILILC